MSPGVTRFLVNGVRHGETLGECEVIEVTVIGAYKPHLLKGLYAVKSRRGELVVPGRDLLAKKEMVKRFMEHWK